MTACGFSQQMRIGILTDYQLKKIKFNNSIGNYDFKWYFGDNDSSYLVNPIHTYLNYGQYNIKLVENSYCRML